MGGFAPVFGGGGALIYKHHHRTTGARVVEVRTIPHQRNGPLTADELRKVHEIKRTFNGTIVE